MKKFYVLLALCVFTSIAHATIVMPTIEISVDGVVNPPEVTLFPSDCVAIDLHGFVAASVGQAVTGYLIAQGPATICGGTVLQGDGTVTGIMPGDEMSPGYTWRNHFADNGYEGVSAQILLIDLYDSTAPICDLDGLLVDCIMFHCDGPGDVELTFLDAQTLIAYDTQIIHQIPEPAMISLMFFGALMLRKRK